MGGFLSSAGQAPQYKEADQQNHIPGRLWTPLSALRLCPMCCLEAIDSNKETRFSGFC
jgi:hypothetical protein